MRKSMDRASSLLPLLFVLLACAADPRVSPDASSWPEERTCVAGEFVIEEDGRRVCAPCPAETFSTEEDAPGCQAWTSCAPGSRVASEPSAVADRGCAPCQAGTFTSDFNQDACAPWTGCAAGEYIVHPPSGAADRVCASCPEGRFSDEPNAWACTPWRDCVPGEFVSEAPSERTDRNCAPCAAGERSYGKNAGSCQPFAPTCEPGTYLSDDVEGECTPCPEGTFSETANADACRPWSVCASGTIVREAGSASSDRVCASCPPGQIGDGPDATTCRPVRYTSVSVSRDIVCALREDQRRACWGKIPGSYWNGNQGYNVAGFPYTPSDERFLSVATGEAHVCALREDGQIVCAGSNAGGESAIPPGLRFKSVSAGAATCGVLEADGRAYCVGSPAHYGGGGLVSSSAYLAFDVGSLLSCGIRTSDRRLDCFGDWVPWLPADSPRTRFRALDMAEFHVCAIREEDDTVACFQASSAPNHGQMDVPTDIPFASIYASPRMTCGVRADTDEFLCWGSGSAMADHVDTASRYLSLDTGDKRQCGVRAADGRIECWGLSTPPRELKETEFAKAIAVVGGHLCGIRKEDERAFCVGMGPLVEVTPPPDRLRALAIGDSGYACGLRAEDDHPVCWGDGATPPDEPLASIYVTDRAGCGLRADGEAVCWGMDAPDGRFQSLSMGGDNHHCGIREDGSISCWGSALEPPEPPEGVFLDVTVGKYQYCAVRADHAIVCWTKRDTRLPEVMGEPVRVMPIENGGCYLRTDGRVSCWGQRLEHLPIPTDGMKAIAGSVQGGEHENTWFCGIREADDAVICWGEPHMPFLR